MTQENTTPAGEPEIQDVPAVPAVEADQSVSGEAAKPETQEEDNETPEQRAEKQRRRADRRISNLLRERYEERARAQMLERQLAELHAHLNGTAAGEQQGQEGQQRQRQVDPVEVEQRAYAKAEFNVKCNAVAERGAAEFPDFKQAIDELRVIGLDEKGLRVLVEADQPHKVLHYLGTHPEEAEALLSLSPVAMARRLGALEARLSAQPTQRLSKAPEPIRPVAAKSGGSNRPSDDDSMEEWLKKRNAQLKGRAA